MHTLVLLEELAQKWDPMKPILDFVVALVDAVGGVERGNGRGRSGHIAPSATVRLDPSIRRVAPASGAAARLQQVRTVPMVLASLGCRGDGSCSGGRAQVGRVAATRRRARGLRGRRVRSGRSRSRSGSGCWRRRRRSGGYGLAWGADERVAAGWPLVAATPNPADVLALFEAVQPPIGAVEVFEVALGGRGSGETLDHLAVDLVVSLEHTLDKEGSHLVDDLVLAAIVAALSRTRHSGAQKEVLLAPDIGSCRGGYVILFAEQRERNSMLVLLDEFPFQLQRQLDVFPAGRDTGCHFVLFA